MSKSDVEKTVEIVRASEEIADKILVNKHELMMLDKRRQSAREAIREIEKNCTAEKKFWITIGSTLVKMERDKALKMLKDDLNKIESDIQILNSDQKVLVNKHRGLEYLPEYTGTNLKALNSKEFSALKSNLPML